MAEFRTFVQVHLWPTKELELTSVVPSFTFKGEEIDMEGSITLGPDDEEVRLTLWNISEPSTVQGIFKKDFLIAVDLCRVDSPSRPGYENPLTRVVIAQVKSLKIITGDTADIGFEVIAIPITQHLKEVKIRSNFPPETGPYRVKAVVEELLHQAGVGIFQVAVDEDLQLSAFTANGTVWSEIKRAIGKAGGHVGIWMQGGTVKVSSVFIAGKTLTDHAILDAAREESNTVQPSLPILTDAIQQVGEGQNLSEQYGSLDEEQQVSQDAASTNAGFTIELPLTEDIFRGSTVIVKDGLALNKMGFFRTTQQTFNVIGVQHEFDTFGGAGVDLTRLIVTQQPENAEAAQ